ncbi:class I SAM-dependent methyltransferase [Neolewinella litorea]|uniref:Class I SAM-dependent methyltransferase n=1 Tax=Neolewinella litorea TaxID=2562452 RepID=A0A4S4N8H0_9BACT|nr:class I SAM-dependent methyltransferase [Neolewinella litorea]THH34338.1 class I SAM-dependent methyltransferase [Neolewinella litorea]
MKDLYIGSDSDYLQKTKSWHSEDSPWKANQILQMIKKNNLKPRTIVEVGCGVGEILYSMNELFEDGNTTFEGYDIAEDAINIARTKNNSNVKFFCKDFGGENAKAFDLLLMIDVFEHVPDYIGFIANCSEKATYKIFHIPLDIHLSSILRGRLIAARNSVGHLHYFTKETALATLEDAGLEILDYFYTDGSTLPRKLRTKIANIPRNMLFPIFPDLTVKLIGGYSLLVLAK